MTRGRDGRSQAVRVRLTEAGVKEGLSSAEETMEAPEVVEEDSTEASRQFLSPTCHSLNPATLLKQINGSLERLWAMVKYPAHNQRFLPLPIFPKFF
ncbi:hypothetical protein ACFLWS_04555 [Chloroflexota bacterium]